MPTYTNTADYTAYFINPSLKILAGEAVETGYYIKGLPAHVELTSDEPIVRPWDLLVENEDGLIDVHDWSSIIVYNSGEDTATISANTDDANALSIPSGSKEVFDNTSGLFGWLEILTGSISVWGGR